MVYAPGHFQQSSEPAKTRRSFRSRRERLAVRAMALLTLVLIGVTAYSLTTHQRTTGHGCVDFNYATMIGGAETYKCGAQARTLCATPPSGENLDTDFQTELYAACRKAGIRTGRA
jgi:hypothetical protein